MQHAMLNSNSSSSSGGIGVFGLLGVAFVILKLCDVIDWSWWWVTAPFWGGLALVLGAGIITLIIAFTAIGIARLFKKGR